MSHIGSHVERSRSSCKLKWQSWALLRLKLTTAQVLLMDEGMMPSRVLIKLLLDDLHLRVREPTGYSGKLNLLSVVLRVHLTLTAVVSLYGMSDLIP